MDTLAPDATMTPAPCVTPSAAHLMDAPLDELLAEFSVDVSEIEAEAGFTGGAYVLADGAIVFVKPSSRPRNEWEMMARFLLGRALRVPLPDLPDPYQITEL